MSCFKLKLLLILLPLAGGSVGLHGENADESMDCARQENFPFPSPCNEREVKKAATEEPKINPRAIDPEWVRQNKFIRFGDYSQNFGSLPRSAPGAGEKSQPKELQGKSGPSQDEAEALKQIREFTISGYLIKLFRAPGLKPVIGEVWKKISSASSSSWMRLREGIYPRQLNKRLTRGVMLQFAAVKPGSRPKYFGFQSAAMREISLNPVSLIAAAPAEVTPRR